MASNVKETSNEVETILECKNISSDPNSFQRVMRPVLITAQIFGLIPVCGITGNATSRIRFTICSFRFFYCIICIAGLAALTVFSIIDMLDNNISFSSSRGIIFFGSATLSYLFFLDLAKKWQHLSVEWEKVEQIQYHYGFPKYLKCKVYTTALIFLFMALTETILANINSVMWGATCQRTGQGDLLYCYAKSSYSHVFNYISYSPAIAVFAIFINFIGTFSWNFTDVFIMLLSQAITERFRLLNDHLHYVEGRILKEASWKRIREEYNNLSCLTKTVNSGISKILLLSYASNLYFICTQLLNSLTPIDSMLEKVYFYLSFGYLLLRAGTSSLFAAEVYSESRVPKEILYSVPSTSYCTEVLRFERQVATDEVAFSPLNFFSVTRGMLLTLAGTIVTYEIVLVQFNHINTDSCPPK